MNDQKLNGKHPPLETVDEATTDVSLPTIEAVVEAFLADSTSPDRASFTSTADIMAAARAWCDDRGEFRFGRRLLAKQLQQRGCKPQRTNTQRGWRGVRLR
jgi:hypothetical protein